ncbi:hypothetical protein [Pseudonocardia sp. NPDC046786]|uniref:hypothetical protein n=1 Tax=Pseudonocardia sp. NPDC046786 TaxID=3155471 RepID=UPI0034078FEA
MTKEPGSEHSTAPGYRAFGGADVQELIDRPDPAPGPAEVLIRVAAAGTVLAVGAHVTGLSVGDRITGFALTGAGSYAGTTLLLGTSTATPPGTSPTGSGHTPRTGSTASSTSSAVPPCAGSPR